MSGLVLEQVGFSFGPRRVLGGVELRAEPGEVIAIAGPNGAGKSTLLRVAAGLLRPASGRSTVDGADSLKASRAGAVSWCGGGEAAFTRRLTLRAALVFHARILGLDAAETRDRIDGLATTFGIAEHLDARADQCSSGLRQRGAVVRALLGRPRVVLMDEPLRGVDAGSVLPLAAAMRTQLAGAAVLWVSHDADELALVATRTLHLRDGRLAAERLASVA